MFAIKITEWLFSLKSSGLWTHLPIVWDKVPNKFVFFDTFPNGDDWIKPKSKDNCLIESTCCVIFPKRGSAVRDPHSRSLKRTLIQQTYSGIWSCTLKKYARLFDGWFKTVCLVGLPKEMLWNSQEWVFSHQGQIFKQMSRKTRL